MRTGDLTARMGATLALVLAIDVAFAVVVAAFLEPWLSPLLAAVGVVSPLGRYVVVTAVSLAALLWAQLHYTRRELLAEANADPIAPESHPDLHARVTRLATLADMRVPAVAVADAETPNSFAVGGARSGTVVVSEGLLETLSDDELEAVLAHELVHLKNHDALVMTLASFLPALVSDEYSLLEETVPEGTKPVVWGGVVLACYVLSSAFIEAPLFSVAGVLQFVAVAGITVVAVGVALGLLATPVVSLSQRLSRQREFVADRDGARLTGNPAALVRALEAIDGTVSKPAEDARTRYSGLDGMCLLPHGFEPDPGPDDETFRVRTRSHPPTEERIARLRELAAELST